MNEERRKVVFYKWVKSDDGKTYKKEAEGHGLFCGWGMDYEEFETGPGNYSTAIVELPDGSVRNIPVEMIVFNN